MPDALTTTDASTVNPLTIRMHDRDNVAIVANDGELAPGTSLPDGPVLRDRVPQGHKVALVDLPADAPVLRYGIPIGYARQDIAAGSWVHERLLRMPDVRGLEGLPIANAKRALLPPLEGYSFEGYRNAGVEIYTHAIGGLSENDFILAAKIDQFAPA